MNPAVLLVVAAVEIAGPSPLLRREHDSIGIVGFYHAGVVEEFVANLLHSRTDRMNVAMGAVPDAVLVIHEIITHAPVGGIAPEIGEVPQPGLLESRVRGEI